jgi:transcriptional regulator of acetoin/glycerol metabolism
VDTPPPAATLDTHRDRLITDTVAACGGNIARAARQLGVSRGLLYRRLRAQGTDGVPPAAP